MTNEEYKDSVRINVCHVVIKGFKRYREIATYPLILFPVIAFAKLNKVKAATIAIIIWDTTTNSIGKLMNLIRAINIKYPKY